MSALPSTEVFAFSEPKFKAGEISFALRLSTGGLHVLVGKRSVWQNLHRYLSTVFGGEVSPAPIKAASIRKDLRRRPRLSAEQRARYVAAFHEWRVSDRTQKQIAQEYGISFGAWAKWLNHHRAEIEAPAA